MPLIDLEDNPEMFAYVMQSAKPKDGGEFEQRDDQEWYNLCNEWHQAKHNAEFYKRHEAMARDALIKAAAAKNCQGFGVKLQKVIRKGSIRYDQIEVLNGIDLEQYRDMPSQSWRITTDET